jgi:hypothetical protein
MTEPTLVLEYGGRDPIEVPAAEARQHAGKRALEAVASILEARPECALGAEHLRDPLRQWDLEISASQETTGNAVDRAVKSNEKFDGVLDAMDQVETTVLAIDEHVTGGAHAR